MTMVDKYLTTEMFEFNALSQFSIALFIYQDWQPCDLCQGQSIQGQGHTLKTKAGQPWDQEILGVKAND